MTNNTPNRHPKEAPPPTNEELVIQITKNLTNTYFTFGAQSPQYRAVLDALRAVIEDADTRIHAQVELEVDADIEGLRALLERGLRVGW